MTDRDPVNEPSLAVQRMAEREMFGGDKPPIQPITLPAISLNANDIVRGSIQDTWGATLVLVQGEDPHSDGLDIVVLDFVQAETLYKLLDQFFNG